MKKSFLPLILILLIAFITLNAQWEKVSMPGSSTDFGSNWSDISSG